MTWTVTFHDENSPEAAKTTRRVPGHLVSLMVMECVTKDDWFPLLWRADVIMLRLEKGERRMTYIIELED